MKKLVPAVAAALLLAGCGGASADAGEGTQKSVEPVTNATPVKAKAHEGLAVGKDDEGMGKDVAAWLDKTHSHDPFYGHITSVVQWADVVMVDMDVHKVTEADAKALSLAACDAVFDHIGLHKADALGLTINREDDATTVAQFTYGPADKQDCYWLGINGSADPTR